jgi:hypothetical protein
MKIIKISHIWTSGIGHVISSLIFNLIKNLSNKEIIFVKPSEADLLIIGCYNLDKISNRVCKGLSRRFKAPKIHDFIESYQQSILFRKTQPLKIFYSTENFRHDAIKADFSITFDLGVNNENHLRIPMWKENIDWSKYGVTREPSFFFKNKKYNFENVLRFGSFYNLTELTQPQESLFLDKKNVCIFTTLLNEPRKTMYNEFSKNFIVHGYGKYFNSSIENHNKSNFTKKEIMQNYAFNLCPHNAIYPGLYEEKVPEAFLGKCLPITWADQNIDKDFNSKAFVNLNDHIKDNYKEIIYLLKQREYLQKFVDQPLLLSEPNLEKEIKFAKKIIDCL